MAARLIQAAAVLMLACAAHCKDLDSPTGYFAIKQLCILASQPVLVYLQAAPAALYLKAIAMLVTILLRPAALSQSSMAPMNRNPRQGT